MSNGFLDRDLKKCTKNTIKSKTIKEKHRLKDSTSLNEVAERASSANPFIWKKDINVWLSEEGQLYLQSWANDGLSNEEIAKKMGIGETTLYRWCNTDERIRSAIMRGRDTMTMDVENMLYKCAKGYYYDEETVTKDGMIVTVKRYAQPSAEAQKFILTNRRRDKWKSKQEVALEAQVQAEAKVEVSKMDQLADELFGEEQEDETIEETESISET